VTLAGFLALIAPSGGSSGLAKEPAFAADTVIAAPMADAANRSRLENMVVLLTIDSSDSSKLGPVALGGSSWPTTFEVVCDDALVKLFDTDRGHVHETVFFFMRPSCSAAKAIADDDSTPTGRIKAATTIAERPAMTAAVSSAATKPAA